MCVFIHTVLDWMCLAASTYYLDAGPKTNPVYPETHLVRYFVKNKTRIAYKTMEFIKSWSHVFAHIHTLCRYVELYSYLLPVSSLVPSPTPISPLIHKSRVCIWANMFFNIVHLLLSCHITYFNLAFFSEYVSGWLIWSLGHPFAYKGYNVILFDWMQCHIFLSIHLFVAHLSLTGQSSNVAPCLWLLQPQFPCPQYL